jgi:hypothetical protein
MMAAKYQLSRGHTLPVMGERELEDHAAFNPGLIGLGASPITEPQMLIGGQR